MSEAKRFIQVSAKDMITNLTSFALNPLPFTQYRILALGNSAQDNKSLINCCIEADNALKKAKCTPILPIHIANEKNNQDESFLDWEQKLYGDESAALYRKSTSSSDTVFYLSSSGDGHHQRHDKTDRYWPINSFWSGNQERGSFRLSQLRATRLTLEERGSSFRDFAPTDATSKSTYQQQEPDASGDGNTFGSLKQSSQAHAHDGGNDDDTILSLLAAQPSHAPAIWSFEDIPPATYGELYDLALDGRGVIPPFVRPDDCVVTFVDEGPIAATVFVLTASHAKAAPLSPAASRQEVLAALIQLKPKLVLTVAKYEEEMSSMIDQIDNTPALRIVTPLNTFAGAFEPRGTDNFVVLEEEYDRKCKRSSEEVALLLRTSGTTSQPKVVPLVLGALVRNGAIIASRLQLTTNDICINAMPLFHVGALSASILATLASGGSVLCVPGFKPESFAMALTRPFAKPTWYSAVPTIHLALLRYVEGLPGGTAAMKHRLRLIRSGAAALSHESALAMRKAWGCPIIPSYSMTECMPIAQCPHDYGLSKPGSVGIPCTGLKIITADKEAPVGTVGEICICGPNIMTAYDNNVEANAATFLDLPEGRFFRTGDLGYLDADGYLFLSGRAKELIKVGGEQVSPHEVEEILYKVSFPEWLLSHPSIWGQNVI